MATVSQAGSRAGLMTALVIFVALFLVAAVMAIVANATAGEKERRLAQLDKKYKDVIRDTDMAGREYSDLKDAASADNSIFGMLVHDRAELAKALSGQAAATPKAAEAALTAAVDRAKKAGGVQLASGSAVSAIDSLGKTLAENKKQMNDLSAQLKVAQDNLKKEMDNYKNSLSEQQKSVQAAEKKASDATTDVTKYREDTEAKVGTLEKSLTDTIEKDRKAVEDLDAQLKIAIAENGKLKGELQKCIEKGAANRPRNVSDPVIRRADGHIIQVEKNGVVYIDRGVGEQIVPGMTFEIYDRIEGVPKNDTSSEETMPVGKGSLEVTRVSAGSSACRIIKIQPGQQPLVGDIVANLIYDPNTKQHFMVYGKFDIDQNGVATDQEADVVKRLITQWGGDLIDKISIDTDFLVMGKEPVVPNATPEQRAADAILDFNIKKAEEELKKYNDIRNAAIEMHIPVLNQNRFLYYIGYYDQAKK
jgi:hypothetical protein